MVFFEPGRYRVTALSVRILNEASQEGTLEDNVLFGHEVEVTGNTAGAYTEVKSMFTGKVGWVDSAPQKMVRLGDPTAPQPTHWVSGEGASARKTIRVVSFREPNPKSEVMLQLPLFSFVSIGERHEDEASGEAFVRLQGVSGVDAWVRPSGLRKIGDYEVDFIDVMERCVGTPYVWGSLDSTAGLDCSGLVVLAKLMCGHRFVERDTKDQIVSRHLGASLDLSGTHRFERGDLVYFKGHVVAMVDDTDCIHATDLRPHHQVLIQPLAEVVRQRGPDGAGRIIGARRDPRYRDARMRRVRPTTQWNPLAA